MYSVRANKTLSTFVATAITLGGAASASAQVTAEPNRNHGNNYQSYVVTLGNQEVRDFHVCMPKPNPPLNAAVIKNALLARETIVRGPGPHDQHRVDGWKMDVDDSQAGKWCINFTTAGTGLRETDKQKEAVFHVAFKRGQEVFRWIHKESAQLFVTNTPANAPANRAKNWSQDVLFKTADDEPVRGPRFASSLQPPQQSDAPQPISGARLVLTGTVVGGSPATATVLGSEGARLSGVVVEVNGEERTSDADGRVVFGVAAGVGSIVASLQGDSGSAVRVPVISRAPVSSAPAIEDAPSFVTPGQSFSIEGGGFSGDATGNTVRFGDREIDVLAASPSELVLAAPSEMAPGEQGLTVSTDQGTSQPRPVSLVALRLDSQDTVLRTGQKGVAYVVVEGTQQPVDLEVSSLTDNVSLKGGGSVLKRTSGGPLNRAKISYRALQVGNFELSAVIVGAKER